MIRFYKLILCCSLIVNALSTVYAQDAHFSQFLYAPSQLNPALTGNFEGRYRAVFNQREQWQSFINPYQTTIISGDARDFMNIKNVGVGINFMYDKVGTTKFRTLQFNLPLSYRIPLSKDSVHSISIGITGGIESQRFDPSQSTFGTQYNGNRYNSNLSGEYFNNQKTTNFTLASGMVYNLYISNRVKIKAGISIFNLSQHNVAFSSTQNTPAAHRFNYHFGAKLYISSQWFLTPGINFSMQGKYEEFIFGSEFNFELDPTRYHYRALFFGGWNRNNDAAIADIGFYYNSWRVGLSYDVNYSQLKPTTQYRGGWEISIIYILKDILPKRNNYKYCPNFL